eukprot:jgi/Chrzof1/12878/Cz07g10190.t1
MVQWLVRRMVGTKAQKQSVNSSCGANSTGVEPLCEASTPYVTPPQSPSLQQDGESAASAYDDQAETEYVDLTASRRFDFPDSHSLYMSNPLNTHVGDQVVKHSQGRTSTPAVVAVLLTTSAQQGRSSPRQYENPNKFNASIDYSPSQQQQPHNNTSQYFTQKQQQQPQQPVPVSTTAWLASVIGKPPSQPMGLLISMACIWGALQLMYHSMLTVVELLQLAAAHRAIALAATGCLLCYALALTHKTMIKSAYRLTSTQYAVACAAMVVGCALIARLLGSYLGTDYIRVVAHDSHGLKPSLLRADTAFSISRQPLSANLWQVVADCKFNYQLLGPVNYALYLGCNIAVPAEARIAAMYVTRGVPNWQLTALVVTAMLAFRLATAVFIYLVGSMISAHSTGSSAGTKKDMPTRKSRTFSNKYAKASKQTMQQMATATVRQHVQTSGVGLLGWYTNNIPGPTVHVGSKGKHAPATKNKPAVLHPAKATAHAVPVCTCSPPDMSTKPVGSRGVISYVLGCACWWVFLPHAIVCWSFSVAYRVVKWSFRLLVPWWLLAGWSLAWWACRRTISLAWMPIDMLAWMLRLV